MRAPFLTSRREVPIHGENASSQADYRSLGSPLIRVQRSVQKLDIQIDPRKGLGPIALELNESLLKGGKKLRPTLVFLMAEVFGLPHSDVFTAGRAIELTHAASLAHDDVIDGSIERRGAPTLHRVVGENRAILGGDLLLAQVMEELLAEKQYSIALPLARAIRDLSRGEWLETAARFDITLTRARLEEIHRLKTGSLTRWATEVAPRQFGLPDSLVEKVGNFGESIGVAFQWMDDLLDFEEGTGKPYAQDLREGVINSVTLEVIEDPVLRKRLQRFFAGELGTDPRGVYPEDLVIRAKERVRWQAQARLGEAFEILRKVCRDAEKLGCTIHWDFLDGADFKSVMDSVIQRSR
jgi:geranylgeranyl pyrophosphate synthase